MLETGADSADLEPPLRRGWVFIDWSAHCSRSENLARRMGMQLLRRHRSFSGPLSFVGKYAYQFLATSWDLASQRPEVVWCMSPTPLVGVPVWLYSALTGKRFAIDAHTGAFEGTAWARLRALQLFLCRRAVLTSVTNDHLRRFVEEGGGHALIVPDVPTELSSPSQRDFGPGFHALYVASYSADEPFEVVLEAARKCPDVTLWLTGKPKGRAKELLASAPANVKALGFLSRQDYLAAIAGAHVVLALTTRNHTMQRAAYEAAYLGTPVIVSDWPVLRENFSRGCLWAQNTAEDLQRCLEQARGEHDRLVTEVRALKQSKLSRWQQARREFIQMMEATEPAASSGRRMPAGQ
jgi:glycosyltransferase involved in cell wall biosynthesis